MCSVVHDRVRVCCDGVLVRRRKWTWKGRWRWRLKRHRRNVGERCALIVSDLVVLEDDLRLLHLDDAWIANLRGI